MQSISTGPKQLMKKKKQFRVRIWLYKFSFLISYTSLYFYEKIGGFLKIENSKF
jgi:hypothetical protein